MRVCKDKFERGLDLVGESKGWLPDSREVCWFSQAAGSLELLGRRQRSRWRRAITNWPCGEPRESGSQQGQKAFKRPGGNTGVGGGRTAQCVTLTPKSLAEGQWAGGCLQASQGSGFCVKRAAYRLLPG